MTLNFLVIVVTLYAASDCCYGDSVETRLERLEAALLQKDNQIDQLQHQLGQMQGRLNTMDSKLAECSKEKVPARPDTSENDKRHFVGPGDNRVVTMDAEEDTERMPDSDDKNTPAILRKQSVPFKRQSSSMKIAFHTYQSRTRSYGVHETIIFDVEELDVGDGYNSGDGIYIVPVTGVYVFTMTIVADYHTFHQCSLSVNGERHGVVFADSDEIHDIHQATGITVIGVDKGDHVYVRNEANSGGNIVSDDMHAKTTFSGWLLFGQ